MKTVSKKCNTYTMFFPNRLKCCVLVWIVTVDDWFTQGDHVAQIRFG